MCAQVLRHIFHIWSIYFTKCAVRSRCCWWLKHASGQFRCEVPLGFEICGIFIGTVLVYYGSTKKTKNIRLILLIWIPHNKFDSSKCFGSTFNFNTGFWCEPSVGGQPVQFHWYFFLWLLWSLRFLVYHCWCWPSDLVTGLLFCHFFFFSTEPRQFHSKLVNKKVICFFYCIQNCVLCTFVFIVMNKKWSVSLNKKDDGDAVLRKNTFTDVVFFYFVFYSDV